MLGIDVLHVNGVSAVRFTNRKQALRKRAPAHPAWAAAWAGVEI
jgi:hypothetical protein